MYLETCKLPHNEADHQRLHVTASLFEAAAFKFLIRTKILDNFDDSVLSSSSFSENGAFDASSDDRLVFSVIFSVSLDLEYTCCPTSEFDFSL